MNKYGVIVCYGWEGGEIDSQYADTVEAESFQEVWSDVSKMIENNRAPDGRHAPCEPSQEIIELDRK